MALKLKKAPADLKPCVHLLHVAETVRVVTQKLGVNPYVEVHFRVEGPTYVTADGALALHLTPATNQPHPIDGKAAALGRRGFYSVTHVGSGASLRSQLVGQKYARAYLEALIAEAEARGLGWHALADGRLTSAKVLQDFWAADAAAIRAADAKVAPEEETDEAHPN